MQYVLALRGIDVTEMAFRNPVYWLAADASLASCCG
jgi:hypothetical protein